MDKKYIVLDQFDVAEKEYNQVYLTEEEAVGKATKNLEGSQRCKQYVALVITEVAAEVEPIIVTVKGV